MCYTYDNLSRVTKRTVKNLNGNVLSEESFCYDAASNITDAPDSCFQYDAQNRLVVFNGNNVSYDLDGNMLNNGVKSFTYDSANKLITADGHTYTYNAEDVRIRNLCADEDTTYTYDTNCRLSKLLCNATLFVLKIEIKSPAKAGLFYQIYVFFSSCNSCSPMIANNSSLV